MITPGVSPSQVRSRWTGAKPAYLNVYHLDQFAEFAGTDETAILATALAAVAARGGGVVEGPAGATLRTQTVNIPSGVKLKGEDESFTIDIIDDATPTGRFLYLHNTVAAALESLTVKCSNVTGRTQVYGVVRLNGDTDTRLNYVTVTSSPGIGFHVMKSTGFEFTSPEASWTQADGMMLNRECKAGRLIDPYMHDTGDDCLSIVSYLALGEETFGNCEDIKVTGLIARNGAKRGLVIAGGRGIQVDGEIDTVASSGLALYANDEDSGLPETHFPVGIEVDLEIKNALQGALIEECRDVEAKLDIDGCHNGLYMQSTGVNVRVKGSIRNSTERNVLIESAWSEEARLLAELFTNLGDPTPTGVGIQGLRLDLVLGKAAAGGARIIGQAAHPIDDVLLNCDSNTGVTATWPEYFLKYVNNIRSASSKAAPGRYRGFQFENCAGAILIGNDAKEQLNAEILKIACSGFIEAGNSWPSSPILTGNPEPAGNNLLGWAFDPATASLGAALSAAGTVETAKIKVLNAGTIHNIVMEITVGGTGLTAGQCLAAIYSEAGALLATTASQHENWLTAGPKTMAIGPLEVAAGATIIVAFYANGTTLPAFRRGVGSNIHSTGLTGLAVRAGKANIGCTTTMPATLEGTIAAGNAWWAAIN